MKKSIGAIFTIINMVLLIISLVAVYLTSINWITIISYALSALQVLVVFHCLFLWRLGAKIIIVRDLLPPDINGTYEGLIKSDYNGGIQKTNTISIKQNLYRTSVITTTDLIRSVSSTCEIKKEDEVFYLYYIYHTLSKSDTNDKNINPETYGGAKLMIVNNSLDGFYWTGNHTTGTINARLINRKTKIK